MRYRTLLLGMMVFYGYVPTWGFFMIPVYLLLTAATALAVGLWAASWIVHYHDVSEILSYVIRGWMYATPVVYAMSIIPERWRTVYRLNPMTHVIEGFRWALLGTGHPPDILTGIYSKMVVTFWAYMHPALQLIAINNLTTVFTFNPQTVR